MVGGVKTDPRHGPASRTSSPAARSSSTGLHGANRLGSNSLLEGLVFGRIAGQIVAERRRDRLSRRRTRSSDRSTPFRPQPAGFGRRAELAARLMWRNVGITRKARRWRGQGDHPVLAAIRHGQDVRRARGLGMPEHADCLAADGPCGRAGGKRAVASTTEWTTPKSMMSDSRNTLRSSKRTEDRQSITWPAGYLGGC